MSVNPAMGLEVLGVKIKKKIGKFHELPRKLIKKFIPHPYPTGEKGGAREWMGGRE